MSLPCHIELFNTMFSLHIHALKEAVVKAMKVTHEPGQVDVINQRLSALEQVRYQFACSLKTFLFLVFRLLVWRLSFATIEMLLDMFFFFLRVTFSCIQEVASNEPRLMAVNHMAEHMHKQGNFNFKSKLLRQGCVSIDSTKNLRADWRPWF